MVKFTNGESSPPMNHMLTELRVKSGKFPLLSDTFRGTLISIWLMRTLKWR